MTEVRTIAEHPRNHLLDGWNLLDVTCLSLMSVGVGFRAFGPADSTSSRSLYALSAPMAFTRVLFYAQILPSQGPMIQVKKRSQRDGEGGNKRTFRRRTVDWVTIFASVWAHVGSTLCGTLRARSGMVGSEDQCAAGA